MRRSILISTIFAAIVALGACEPKTPEVKPPAATPTPAATASPVASPAASPAKPGTTPEVKKDDGKNVNGNKEVKPAETPKAK